MTSLKTLLIGAGVATMLLASCGNGGKTLSGLDPAKFDTVINEKPVKLYTLTNKKGLEVCITNFGGRVVSLMVPDRQGNFIDVVLGYDNIAQYADTVNSPSDFGATIGRYANRINKGQLTIAGEKIQLPVNNFGHCLHGGPSGWQYQVYDAEQIDDQTLKLTIVSPDGDNNFPGTVTAIATYKLTDDNALDCTFEATTDKETVINMCNHSYFTLTGPHMELYSMMTQEGLCSFSRSARSLEFSSSELSSITRTPLFFSRDLASHSASPSSQQMTRVLPPLVKRSLPSTVRPSVVLPDSMKPVIR